MATVAPPVDPTRSDYGQQVAAVEPGGVEPIPDNERHGSPWQLVWTWASPNMEFATVFVGVIGVLYFGQSFAQALTAIVLGSALGAVTQGILSTWGPPSGRAQMVLGRSAFGFFGNVLPAGLNALTAGIGWFAVNSVSGALALSTLTGMPKALGLIIVVAVQIVVAFFGHNLVQVFERYAFPFLAVVFVIAGVSVLGKAHLSAHGSGGTPAFGAFTLELSAAFGYAAGWNPYAADYTRYLPAATSRLRIALSAAAGIFVSCAFLEIVGAASATIATGDSNPTGAFTGIMPKPIADLTLIAIALGAVAANVLNIYSGAMSFLAVGIDLPFALRRALIALVFGAIGFVVALTGLHDAGEKYDNFLLVVAYWIAPWLGVVFVDRFLRRGRPELDRAQAIDDRRYFNWAGPVAMLAGILVSIFLFSNQSEFVGSIAKAHPAVGDITLFVGFAIAAALYAVLQPLVRRGSVGQPVGGGRDQ